MPPASGLPKSQTLGLIPPIDALQTNRVNVRTPSFSSHNYYDPTGFMQPPVHSPRLMMT